MEVETIRLVKCTVLKIKSHKINNKVKQMHIHRVGGGGRKSAKEAMASSSAIIEATLNLLDETECEKKQLCRFVACLEAGISGTQGRQTKIEAYFAL